MSKKRDTPDAGSPDLIQLSEEGQRRFAEMQATPAAPNEAMMALGALQGFKLRTSDAPNGGAHMTPRRLAAAICSYLSLFIICNVCLG